MYLPGHWQVKLPGSLLQIAPGKHGLAAHSLISSQPPFGVAVKPELQRHLASLLINIH